MKLNHKDQDYKGITLTLLKRNYTGYAAKRYLLNNTSQNVWIPNKHLEHDGTIKQGEDLDYVFRNAPRKLELAGYKGPIAGIKRRSEEGGKSNAKTD
ncbi:hypothetical protein GCM10010912_17930 [Paenibacillus albidus]|uniref:Uncharacterized protein n=1 Tax=Paenibacillus albidus TaxID=2041023 RepID=A0A917C5Q8_9BACL|nr:hypothetical protein [Paenibacillus albidus]GGF73143.1 hypothetical protein GCM10010912_17930 [Paenibacillus albidus]